MKREIVFKEVNSDGSVTINGLKDFIGGKVKITIEKGSKRSLPQNSFYWGNFISSQIECFKERWGETYRKEQVHEWNKVNFWGTEHIVESTGEIIKIPDSSTKFSKLEWEEKLDTIRAWFLQNMDWTIGYPMEQYDLDFDRK